MRLIDADALKAKLEKRLIWMIRGGLSILWCLTKIMISILDEVPTAKERDKGHWIDIDLDTSICSVWQKTTRIRNKILPGVRRVDGE